MMQHMNRVLFVCHYHEPLRSTILPIAQALKQPGDLAPYVIVESDQDGRMEAMCDRANVDCRALSRKSKRLGHTKPDQAKSAPVATPQKRRRMGLLRWTLGTIGHIGSAYVKIRRLTKILKQLQPAVVVLLDDRTLSASRWIRAAERRNIPTVTIQWAATHRADALLAVRSAQPRIRQPTAIMRAVEQTLVNLVPRAAHPHNDRLVWWIAPDQFLAHWLLGLFPRVSPWTFGGGNSNSVALFGNEWKQRMIRDGVFPDKLIVTGHPEQDLWFRIASNWRDQDTRQVASELDIATDRHIVTVISPAFCFRKGRGCRVGDSTLEQLREDLGFIVGAIRELGDDYVPVVKIHPRDQLEDVTFLNSREEPPVCITRDIEIHRLIAASRAMTCQWSTTAMLGQAVGTPVAVFDFHQSPSGDMWKGKSGLPFAETRAEFEDLLHYCLVDEDARAEILQRRERFIKQYLCLDGKATHRLTSLIRQHAGLLQDNRDTDSSDHSGNMKAA